MEKNKYYPASASDKIITSRIWDGLPLLEPDYKKVIGKITEMLPTDDPDSEAHILYTLKHKIAIMALSFEYLGYISRRIILHDTDKLFLYSVTNTKEVHQIHLANSCHHYPNLTNPILDKQTQNHMEAVLDYECARYTKPDKPLNAYSTILKFFPESMSLSVDILDAFGINSEINRDCKFEKWKQVAPFYLSVFCTMNQECLTGRELPGH